MKPFLTTLLAIICGGVLLWGNIHWSNKTAVKVDGASVTKAVEKPAEKSKAKSEDTQGQEVGLLSLTKNWPVEAVETFKKAQEEGQEYKVLIVGSNALGEEPNGWAYQTKDGLTEAFGDENLIVEILKYETTSLNFVQENHQEELVAAEADLIIFEPFTLNDNTNGVGAENSLINVQRVLDHIGDVSANTVVILTPPNPLYNAKYYPLQVDALKEYAEENDIPYLDHWTAWPELDSQEMNDYLTNGSPNEKGHELWAQYMLDYLVAKN
ncbi:SGNH/GDSL hydrolase family protein [Mesobacillus selenatarsenatis]|uniref:EPSX protEIN n=1 Tax=Mesobacillus selenatarsenatis (strain DSM 18680 / JCM 14380 / FERM P-15431 / SF-1) TaxID=1321606 RepID=A0A0A8X8G9_MESS1|nr:SGNH/GDSL hydrolase family protein [Mesobacillus selenatarsenatis]GAM16223.1 EPSX protEIN [Mesobacillus selenatarsenatis SF-1]